MPIDTTTNNQKNTAFVNNPDLYHKEIRTMPAPERGIGIDTKETIFSNIVQAGLSSQLDISALESFTSISQSRNTVYSLLDMMCEDATVAAVLETYAEDATEYNDEGQIVWAESSIPEVQKYVQFLLDTMNIDKNIYRWVYSLCKYGDIYLRLYRESDWKEDDLFSNGKEKTSLNEDVKIKKYSQNDHYVNYLEMYPNPADIFELTKFGKSYAYINAPSKTGNTNTNSQFQLQGTMSYRFKKNDVNLHGPTDFVHACLEDNSSRTPETVQIFTSENENSECLTYTVKRGQSLLYNTFKTWRELQLLENSVLLNRVTKSSIVRLISVEVGDMPKEQIGPHLQGIKSLIEQKSALKAGSSISEYTNPGPIENNIYIPTHEGIGAITTSQIGGDVDVKSLADLDYYQDKWFGSLRVPKQYFGVTDDNAGFSGGQSLSIISSRYGKMVKRIQNTILQALTDAINLLLLDRNLIKYVNEFTLHMLPPTTQEELDRRENLSSKVQLTSDIMNMLTDIENTEVKLKILKSLLSNILTNGEVIGLIQEEIDKLELQNQESEQTEDSTLTGEGEDETDIQFDSADPLQVDNDFNFEVEEPGNETIEPVDNLGGDDSMEDIGTDLPSGEDLGIDLTQNV